MSVIVVKVNVSSSVLTVRRTNLANIVDDYLMKISHVIRGEEWLPSLPLHVMLYRAFGWDRKEGWEIVRCSIHGLHHRPIQTNEHDHNQQREQQVDSG